MNCFAKVGVCFLVIIFLILSFAGLATFSLGESLFIDSTYPQLKKIFTVFYFFGKN